MFTAPPTLLGDESSRKNFSKIVHWARDNHPFYTDRLKNHNLEIELLQRRDILERNDVFLNGNPETSRTSGSTGIPVRMSWSPDKQKIERVVTENFVKQLGGPVKVTQIIHSPHQSRLQSGDGLDISTPIDQQIEYIHRRYQTHQAIGITTYPTNAEHLSRYALDNGLDMSFIKRLGLYAEVLEPDQERLIRQAFPLAQLWSTYSSQEVGMIAFRCPHEPSFHHLNFRKLGVEILDQDGNAAKEGELGRVILTDYFNTYSTFIRYEIGDLAAPGTCPCGRIQAPALSRLAGKVRGALVHADSRRVPFTSLSVALRDIDGMIQYQVIQNAIGDFELRYVRNSDIMSDAAFKKNVRAVFKAEFGTTQKIKFTREDVIEKGANGKFYASISKI